MASPVEFIRFVLAILGVFVGVIFSMIMIIPSHLNSPHDIFAMTTIVIGYGALGAIGGYYYQYLMPFLALSLF